MDCDQLLVNIQLDQYDQVSCLKPNSKVIAGFGPLYKNEANEIYFDLSQKRDFDIFSPLNNSDKTKFLEVFEKSGRLLQIEQLITKCIDNDLIKYKERTIFISSTISELDLLSKGIKGNFTNGKSIELYLPLTIKNKHIIDIFSILKDLCI